MKKIILQTTPLLLVASFLFGQDTPLTGDPYAARGRTKSPDGKYDWIVREIPTIRYELINVDTGDAIATVSSYYPTTNAINVRYANAVGVYWNRDSTVVALDELNRRRAGSLYFFTLSEGKATRYRAEQFIPIPKTLDEARPVVDPGWVSPTEIRLRLAAKSHGRDARSKFYLVDFSNPNAPRVQASEAASPSRRLLPTYDDTPSVPSHI
jgi:hypothetical protein